MPTITQIADDCMDVVIENMDQGPTEEELKQLKIRQDCLKKLQEIIPTEHNLRELKVERVEAGYVLAIHPEPIFKRHSLLLKPDNFIWSEPFGQTCEYIQGLEAPEEATAKQIRLLEEKKERARIAEGDEEERKNQIRVFDFSDTQKIRYTTDIYPLVQEEKEIQGTNSNLNSKFYDAFCPFTCQDIEVIGNMISKLDCYALYRAMPTDYKETRQFMSQCIHIVPRESMKREAHHLDGQVFKSSSLDFEKLFENLDLMTKYQDTLDVRKEAKVLEREQKKLIENEEKLKADLAALEQLQKQRKIDQMNEEMAANNPKSKKNMEKRDTKVGITKDEQSVAEGSVDKEKSQTEKSPGQTQESFNKPGPGQEGEDQVIEENQNQDTENQQQAVVEEEVASEEFEEDHPYASNFWTISIQPTNINPFRKLENSPFHLSKDRF